MSEQAGHRGKRLRINGVVQGVGFRPYVYRLASSWRLCGWVLNAGDGVHVHIEGSPGDLTGFVSQLRDCAPDAAVINELAIEDALAEGFGDFVIRPSTGIDNSRRTLISADIATCPQCLAELFDSADRRYHYPFINCTNCGPRFTIIGSLPYDRPNTSMAGFEMCGRCSSEYHQPLDRRFHAQPDACFDCGPSLTLWRSGQGAAGAGGGRDLAYRRQHSDGLIAEVAGLLLAGQIVALKGLGGYHLACDASNLQAVERLRRRKRRKAKPFALMLPSLDDAHRLCFVDELEAELLSGTVRPIVLLRRRAADGGAAGSGSLVAADAAAGDSPWVVADAVAGNLHELGIMLPYTPLQHLLMAEVQGPLVMTSGNASEEPIAASESDAHLRLAGIADAFLDNDRDILSRYDDSVMRVVDGRCQVLRRARGLAPRPVAFPESSRPLLAVGAEQKNSFCLTDGQEAFVSQHIGDLENADCLNFWQSTLTLYQRLFNIDYQTIACDKHPDYLASKWAWRQDMDCLEVQHHHAHIAAVLAESLASGQSVGGHSQPVDGHGNGKAGGSGDGGRVGDDGEAGGSGGKAGAEHRVIGLAFDGTGLGDDGSIWGGELLLVSLASSQRLGCLRPVCLPGGSAAIRHPDRMAWSYLYSLGLSGHPGAAALAAGLDAGLDAGLGDGLGDGHHSLERIIDRRVNSPLTSSMGRLFDAVSALLGVCCLADYEGQPAIELEAALYDRSTGLAVVDADADEAAGRYTFQITDIRADGHRDDALPLAGRYRPGLQSGQEAPAQIAGKARNKDGQGRCASASQSAPLTAFVAMGNTSAHGNGTVGCEGLGGNGLDEDGDNGGFYQFDPSPVLQAILDDLVAGLPVALASLRFHDAVVRLMVESCRLASARTGLTTVALGGGVFMNRYLLAKGRAALETDGFTVLQGRELPPNDGCISYGQAAVAAARLAATQDLA